MIAPRISLILLLSLGPVIGVQATPSALRPSAPRWIEFYVSPDGNDHWSGAHPAPLADHSDGPFATLERARDAIRDLNRKARTDHGVVVYLRGGIHLRTQSFHLEAQDGGSIARPLVYRSYPSEQARLIGGHPVQNFLPVTDPAILDRLDPSARGKVLQVDLRAQGITDFGQFTPLGFHRPINPAPLELFINGETMPLAHWPNSGFASITAAPAGPDAGRFTFDDPRLARWTHSPDLWIHGYWTRDWADSYEKVKYINVGTHEIVTEPPHGIYGYSKGKRFVVLNVFEELNEPGEWYLDRASGILYYWPAAPIRDGAAFVSTLGDPLVVIHGAAFVNFRDISFECSRGAGMIMTGASHSHVVHCSFSNLGSFAVSVGSHGENLTDDLYKEPTLDTDAGFDNGIIACDIRHVGEGGILLGGGDRKSLAPGNNFAVNNLIADYSRWVRTYRPGIYVHGVGNRVAHNRITDAPHVGILLAGNDHIVEYNEIARVCTETADSGAIYMGRDFTERGNVVRFNLIRQCGNAGAFSNNVNAIYLDDCASGVLVYGNIIHQCGCGVLIGGGRDNTIDNNLFIDCNPAIFIDARGLSWMKTFFDGTEPILFDRLKQLHSSEPPYARRYPELARILVEQPAIPKGNKIQHNVCQGGQWIHMPDNCDARIFEIKDNFTDGDAQLTAPDKLDFRPATASPVWAVGFHPIPMNKIGLQLD
ncbi:MAG TPA: right-handed parallel beta-helix repeat-containing protein, partial [Humisphaera sp.]|nr:right-handed parallel beta-helix repeat-containing protein [Humisphaera sp.]